MTASYKRRGPLSFVLAFAALALVMFGVGPAFAQSNKGTIVGVVTDQSGAVVAGAKVVVTNVETNQSREVESSADGEYVAALLDIGIYRVEASAPNFAGGRVEDVVLKVGDRLAIDVTLAPAGATEAVTVTATDEPLLERETSTRGDTITGRQITELPLSGRNFTQLATLAPGVSRQLGAGPLTDATALNQGDPRAGGLPGQNPTGSTEAARFSRSGGAQISANGQRTTNNNFSVDGIDNNEPLFGSIGIYPPPDAIAEFKVETSVPRAEVGRAAGAVVNTTYRSGTNEFHGSAYYYGQNSALNALHPVIKGRAIVTNDPASFARQEALNNKKAVQQIHEYGATIGGPIVQDRTFFFFSFLGQRNNMPVPFSTAVPTALSRTGDFSEFDATLVDPRTGQPFQGNRIPNLQGRPDFSPVGFAFLNAFPLPTINVRNPSFGNPNYFIQRDINEQIDSYDIKIDHRFSDNNSINGRYSFFDQKRQRQSVLPTLPSGFGAGDEFGDTRQVSITNVHTFTPTVLNEFRFGWTSILIAIHNPGVQGAQGFDPMQAANLGIPNTNRGGPETTGFPLVGVAFAAAGDEIEFVGDGGLFEVDSDNFYIADSLTVVRGGHTVKFGGEMRHRRVSYVDGGRSGFLKGHLQFTGNATNFAQAGVLLSQSSGFGTISDVPGGPFNIRQNELAFFVQDDWKVSSDLTINAGLRWDYLPGVTEAAGRMGNYNPATGVVEIAAGGDDPLIDNDKNNFGPRIGFAWTFGEDKDWVLRGGYGLVYTLDGADRYPLTFNPPFTNSVNYFGDAGVTFDTGPPIPPAIDPNNLPTAIGLGYAIFGVQQEQKTAHVHQYNLGIQWGFADNWVWDIAYVGNRSYNLLSAIPIGSGGGGYVGLTPGTGDARNAAGQPLDFVVFYENEARAWYDALQTQVQRRFVNGFQARASYTFSKTLDNSPGIFTSSGDARGGVAGPVNPLNPYDGEKGLAAQHAKHLFSGNLIWELPFGEGRKLLNEGGLADYIVGDWQVNFLFNGRSGYVFSPISPGSPTGTRAELTGRDPYTGRENVYLNADAFAPAAQVVVNNAGRQIVYGGAGRNTLVGPGYFRTDASVLKNFEITEEVRLEMGVQFFNLFNQANYLIPDNNITSGTFGQFFSALPARQVQYRLRLLF